MRDALFSTAMMVDVTCVVSALVLIGLYGPSVPLVAVLVIGLVFALSAALNISTTHRKAQS